MAPLKVEYSNQVSTFHLLAFHLLVKKKLGPGKSIGTSKLMGTSKSMGTGKN